MTKKLANRKKLKSILQFRRIFLRAWLELYHKRGHITPINWRLNCNARHALTFGVVAIILVSCFAFLSWESSPKANIVIQPQDNNSISPYAISHPSPTPTPGSQGSSLSKLAGIINTISQAVGLVSPPKPPGTVESSPAMNDNVWTKVAENAWAFFQPGIGVDNVTGIPYAGGVAFKACTDWDLGAYIQAVIDAQEIGLINATGPWGGYERLNMVLTFLENRPLNATTDWPFWFYDATNGKGYLETADYASNSVDVVDTGKLFVALNNIIAFNSSFTQRVDNFVLNGRSNYASLVPTISSWVNSNSTYAYYTASGFASFWPKQIGGVPSQIITNIVNTQNITTYGVTLPDVPLTCEPLLLSIFELNKTDSRLTSLMAQVYQAQEAYYANNGTYAAFTEGSSIFNGYVYEWIIAPNGNLWQIDNASQYYFNGAIPVIFTKAAFGFLSLYNDTFARNMVIYLEQALPTPTKGYFDGVDSNENLDAGNPGSDTNSLILDASIYYIQNSPNG